MLTQYQYALWHRTSGQPLTMTDVNCHWLLNRRGFMTHCFTCLQWTITDSVIMCPKSKKLLIVVCVDCVSRVWWRGCNCRWLVRLCGCLATHRWRLTLSSSFVTNYVSRHHDQRYCCLSHKYKYNSEPFYNDFSLCTEMVQKCTPCPEG